MFVDCKPKNVILFQKLKNSSVYTVQYKVYQIERYGLQSTVKNTKLVPLVFAVCKKKKH